eukprot:6088965-Amphidinium_carterae.1
MDITTPAHIVVYLDSGSRWSITSTAAGVCASLPEPHCSAANRPQVCIHDSGNIYISSGASAVWLSEVLPQNVLEVDSTCYILEGESTIELHDWFASNQPRVVCLHDGICTFGLQVFCFDRPQNTELSRVSWSLPSLVEALGLDSHKSRGQVVHHEWSKWHAWCTLWGMGRGHLRLGPPSAQTPALDRIDASTTPHRDWRVLPVPSASTMSLIALLLKMASDKRVKREKEAALKGLLTCLCRFALQGTGTMEVFAHEKDRAMRAACITISYVDGTINIANLLACSRMPKPLVDRFRMMDLQQPLKPAMDFLLCAFDFNVVPVLMLNVIQRVAEKVELQALDATVTLWSFMSMGSHRATLFVRAVAQLWWSPQRSTTSVHWSGKLHSIISLPVARFRILLCFIFRQMGAGLRVGSVSWQSLRLRRKWLLGYHRRLKQNTVWTPIISNVRKNKRKGSI